MSERLQVLLPADEFAEIRRIAKRQRLSVAEWVRQALRRARDDASPADPRRKLAAVREAASHGYPTGDIGQLLTEIEHGYGAGELP